jgi:hypothetical protein
MQSIIARSSSVLALVLFSVALAGCQSDKSSPDPALTNDSKSVQNGEAEPDAQSVDPTSSSAAEITSEPSSEQMPDPCTDEWYAWVEEMVSTGDGAGHGPDPGSNEWKYSIIFKLGLEGKDGVPTPDDQNWCKFVDRVVQSSKG